MLCVFVAAIWCVIYSAVDGNIAVRQAECTVCEVLQTQRNVIREGEETKARLGAIEESIGQLQSSLKTVVDRYSGKYNAKDCADLYTNGIKLSGVYTIHPRDNNGLIDVYCDMTTDGGGWTVFQKRLDGSENFYREWNDYKHGFGNLNGEFWLGNDHVNRLTNQDTYQLRFDLEDTSGTQVYAVYETFSIFSERANYQLSVGNYSGNAGDSFGYTHNGLPFSTKDRDNDVHASGSCAVSYSGAWWYSKCHSSNLNGLYHHGDHKSYADGVNWYTFKGHYYSLKRTSMKIRPARFSSAN